MKNLVWLTLMLWIGILSAFPAERPEPPFRTTNTWQGDYNFYWSNANNWDQGHIPLGSEQVVIPGGCPRYPYVSDGRSCYSLVIQSGAQVYIQEGQLSITAYVDSYGYLSMLNSSGYMIVSGNMNFFSGAGISVSAGQTPYIDVSGNLVFYAGSNVNINGGSINLVGTTQLITTWANAALYNLNVFCTDCYHSDGSSGQLTLNGSFQVGNSCNYTDTNDLSTNFKGSIFISSSGSLKLYNGSANLQGSSDTTVHLSSTSFFYSLDINKTAGNHATLSSNIDVNRDLTINTGTLVSAGYDICVARNWSNYAGDSGFNESYESNAKVIFDGSGIQHIMTPEHFNFVNHPFGSGGLYIDSGVDVYAYNFWNSSTMYIQGNLSVDMCFPAFFQGYVSSSGNVQMFAWVINFDVTGLLGITDGTFNIIGAQGCLTFIDNSGLSMSGGVLDVSQMSLKFNPAAVVSFSAPGGTIRTTGDLTIESPGFNPSCGTISLYGYNNCLVDLDPSATLFNLSVDKESGYNASLISDISSISCLYVNSGIFSAASHHLNVLSFVNVHGLMYLLSSARLGMGNGSSLTVFDGGQLEAQGSDFEYAQITTNDISHHYSLTVNSGGTIAARYASFEYMDADGVNIQPGALVDPNHAFYGCAFRYGQAGGTLLTINNSQDIWLIYAHFPTNTWGSAHNVAKTVDQGSLHFILAQEPFSGAAFEQDPYYRIFWTGSIPPVDDLSATYNAQTGMIRLEWTYPIPEASFKLYGATSAYGSFSFQQNVFGRSIEFTPGTRKFFYVTAWLP